MTDTRTKFAMAAVDFAGVFSQVFSKLAFAGLRLKITAPEGQSTGGGVQARQNLTLINESDGKALVIGACSTVEKTAELRTYEYAAHLYRQRTQAALPLAKPEYEDLVKKLQGFFDAQQFQVTVAQGPKPGTAAAAALIKKSSATMVIGFVLLLAVAAAAGLIYFFLFRK